MTRHHVFDTSLQVANLWLDQLSKSVGLTPHDQQRTLHALRAGLHAIRDRLPIAEVIDLGAQLPTLIRGLYYEGWTGTHDPTEIRDRTAMVARVASNLGRDDRLDPLDVLRGVIQLLVEHVSPGEIADIITTLPRPLAMLWKDVAENEAIVGEARTRPRKKLVHHTGYSR